MTPFLLVAFVLGWVTAEVLRPRDDTATFARRLAQGMNPDQAMAGLTYSDGINAILDYRIATNLRECQESLDRIAAMRRP